MGRMSLLDIVQIPVLTDNYVYLLRDQASGRTAVVDPADAGPVLAALTQRGWKLDFILNTHHHGDHVGGNRQLVADTGCHVVGPAADRARIPLIGTEVADGDQFALGDSVATVFDVPGHTSGHIAYWFARSQALFCGDTLFALGCGRLFEGTPAQMWQSLGKLSALPDDTRVYCAHEYTLSNARFAVTVDPENDILQQRAEAVGALRAAGRPTVPSLLGEEKATNPFLRADQPGVAAAIGLSAGDPVAVFAEVRRRKDHF